MRFKYGIKPGDLQYVLYMFGEPRQFDRGAGYARAVYVRYVAQIQQNLLSPFGCQIAHCLAYKAGAFAECQRQFQPFAERHSGYIGVSVSSNCKTDLADFARELSVSLRRDSAEAQSAGTMITCPPLTCARKTG